MTILHFSKSGTAIEDFDLIELQKVIRHELPDSFKKFFLKNNGGVPDRDWWDSGDEYEPIRVKKFKSVAVAGADDAGETKYLGGCYLAMTSREVVPQTLLPFAIDDGGNFFCLDLSDGNVCFYAIDAFDSDSSFSTNHARAYRWLAASFEAFINGLVNESEVDI
ncbi:SMI1/KNR4 family protein [Pseudomonas sp. NFR16]|uniref:SMI1/KNR4 family protein n=1 Tax=Pseudomonas sp. NFR16 TaxID=1566248 RepID=UPI0008B0B9EE|nr:SMI1/KNR4 family protein [Pseudomonas sp. NFR16]SEI46981.1 SMI1 / KNR4 family (SUKH-1) [Pseudomonas sp. NFR16]